MASTTPPNLSAQTTVASGDLMLVWPVGSGGPLQKITYTNFTTQVASTLGGSFLMVASNLSDVPNPTTARTNLGLGTAAIADVGTSGAKVPALNAANTWSGDQSFATNVTLGDAAADLVTINAKNVLRVNMPAVFAKLSAAVTNVTGDATFYQVVFNSKPTDRGTDFNATTGVFTAPATGLYLISFQVQMTGVLPAHSRFVTRVLTTSQTYQSDWGDLQPDSSARVAPPPLVVLAAMTAADTASFFVEVEGSTKVIGLLNDSAGGSSSPATYVSICQVG